MKTTEHFMETLLREFEKEYELLYNSKAYIAGTNEAIEAFDSEIKEDELFKAIVGKFAEHRGDAISSDREAAAFMFALQGIVE